jgi:hypothetical protein
MIPVKRPWTNITMGEGQDHVLPCPAFKDHSTGDVIIAWSLTDEEAAAVAKTKSVMLKVYTYNRPIQPAQMWAVDENEEPIKDERI